MSRIQYVETVLQELGAGMGLADLRFDASDRASLLLDDNIPITFAYRAAPVEMLCLYIDRGDIPQKGRQAPEYLLRAGLTTWLSTAMTISLDDEGKKALAITMIAVATLDLATLTAVLEKAVIVARVMRDYIKQGQFEPVQLTD